MTEITFMFKNSYKMFEETPVSKADITLDYWDSECETNYIHSVKVDYCTFCKAKREDMPNSRKDEICIKNMCNCILD